jgi:hypothetical protein
LFDVVAVRGSRARTDPITHTIAIANRIDGVLFMFNSPLARIDQFVIIGINPSGTLFYAIRTAPVKAERVNSRFLLNVMIFEGE